MAEGDELSQDEPPAKKARLDSDDVAVVAVAPSARAERPAEGTTAGIAKTGATGGTAKAGETGGTWEAGGTGAVEETQEAQATTARGHNVAAAVVPIDPGSVASSTGAGAIQGPNPQVEHADEIVPAAVGPVDPGLVASSTGAIQGPNPQAEQPGQIVPPAAGAVDPGLVASATGAPPRPNTQPEHAGQIVSAAVGAVNPGQLASATGAIPGSNPQAEHAGQIVPAAVGPKDPGLVASATGAYTDREASLQKQEDEGDLAFIYVVNNNEPANNLCLLHLKNIFSRQLPNMPKEYIARLVFDRRHRSVAVVRRKGTVMGGITYRPFPHAGFGEIAFCAVSGTEQVKGFGTRLMNYTKEFARQHDGIRYFLTYADNNAVGYFLKQGFTKEITSDKEQWHGYIKEYDGGTLMEFVIHDGLPYTRFPDMIRAQRQALDSRIRQLSNSHLVYPGLQVFRTEPRPVLQPEDIPGVVEAGYNPADMGPAGPHVFLEGNWCPPTHENLHRLMQDALSLLQRHEDAWPFLEAVDVRDVPDYLDIIKDPMDLSKMERRVKSRTYYMTLAMFVADFKLMKANCERYNTPDTVYVRAILNLNSALENFLKLRTSWTHVGTQ